MGSSDTDKPAKEPVTPSPTTAPEQSTATSTAAVNAEWSGFQAYSPIPPPGFMASNPQAHPYVWGVQHMMPPYGTPPHPYVAMYPHGGVYAHPTMPPGSYPFPPFAIPSPNGMVEATGNNTHGSADADAKPPEGKEKLPVKRMRGSLGSLNMITGKSNEKGKTGTVANGGGSKSAESGSDGSSEGSDADSQNDSPTKSRGRQEVGEAVVSQNGNSTHATQNGVVNVPHTMVNHAMPVVPMAGPGPATNLNIGMDYWGVPASSPIPAVQGHVSASVAAGMDSAGSHDNLQSQLWLQDERELKRQRRKQSNRESARRSRLRKQAECDELAQRAEVLQQENANLRSELSRIRNDYGHLIAENNKLKERLGETPEGLGSSDAELRLANETQESVKTTDKGKSG